MKFKSWLIKENQNNNFELFVGNVYRKYILNKILTEDDLESHFYDYLTGSANGLNTEYRSRILSKEEYKNFQNTYQNIKRNWDLGNWKYNDTGGSWEHFYKKGEQLNPQYNLKRYITLAEPKSQEMKKFDTLLKNLYPINSVHSVKIPVFVTALIPGVDNIVVYFEDKNDKNAINDAIKNSGIQEKDRSDLHRSNFGVDALHNNSTRKLSDTELSAKFYVKQLNEWLNTPHNNSTIRDSLKKLPEKQAIDHLKNALLVIFKYKPPHRNKIL
jgi:hypothetical protein